MPRCKGRTVHRGGDQHLGRQGLAHRDRRAEAETLSIDVDVVQRGEADMKRVRTVRAGRAKDVGEGDTRPERVADRSRGPGIARYRTNLQHVRSPVAGALHRGFDRPMRQAGEFLHRQPKRCLDEPIDDEGEGLGVNIGRVAVAPHVEVGLVRHVVRAERGEGRLRVERRLGMHDQMIRGHRVSYRLINGWFHRRLRQAMQLSERSSRAERANAKQPVASMSRCGSLCNARRSTRMARRLIASRTDKVAGAWVGMRMRRAGPRPARWNTRRPGSPPLPLPRPPAAAIGRSSCRWNDPAASADAAVPVPKATF